MKIVKLLFLCISISPLLCAQNDIALGTWRTHLSYNNVIDIALVDEKVYSATKNAVFVYDKEDGSIQTITKLNGLNGNEISAIAYSTSTSTLVIGYRDGNIDMIKNNVISNIFTIKNDNFTNDKSINSIYILGSLAYLAADFGISIIDLEKSVIKETAVGLGPNRIYEATILDNSLFAATSDGVISVSLEPSVNFLDFNNWLLFETNNQVISIVNSNNQLYAAESSGSFYQFNAGSWEATPVLTGETFVDLSTSVAGILIITESGIWKYESASLSPINIADVNPKKVAQDQSGVIWIGDQNRGLVKVISENNTKSITPSGPTSGNSYRTAFFQDQIFTVSGGISDNDLGLNRKDGFYRFDGIWTSYNNNGTGLSIPEMNDLSSLAYNPLTRELALASFGDGLLLVDENNDTQVINELSSGSTLSDGIISDVEYGNEGLWVLNYGQSKSVHHWSDNGDWEAFTLSNTATQYPLEIIIAQNNDKWLRLSPEKGGGLFVFNEETGKQRLLNNTANNGNLPSSKVHAIAEDHNGLIWVGTGRGIAYFNTSSSVEDNNTVNAITPKVGGFVPLFRDEKILSITVDAGNRKWIGTENGVWLFDENGEVEVNYFNINNSPLPSNNIISIAINNNTGEVFFCTDLGVVSYRGTATIGTEVHQTIKIFPNPITRDFNGLVSISGLANGAIVKITDISGKLIRQMKSNGGTAVWNAQDYRGNRASTGVYLIFSSTEDGKDSLVGKLAIVN